MVAIMATTIIMAQLIKRTKPRELVVVVVTATIMVTITIIMPQLSNIKKARENVAIVMMAMIMVTTTITANYRAYLAISPVAAVKPMKNLVRKCPVVAARERTAVKVTLIRY